MFGSYRCILALFVVVGHLLGMRHSAGAAVFSFYILSGFLMTHIMQERYQYSAKSFFSFCYHRILRLYPMYWIAFAIALLGIVYLGAELTTSVNKKMYMPEGVSQWLWNLFIVSPSWHPIDVEPRLVSPAWALTVEIFYYIIIALGISKSKKLTWVWVSVSLMYYVATFFLGFGFGWRSKALLCASLPFSVGAILFYYKDSFQKLRGDRVWAKVLVIVIYSLISTASYIILDLTSPSSADALLAFSFIPSTLALLVLYPRLEKANSKLTKFDNMLGSLSYPFYVLHWPVSIWVVHFLKLNPDLGLNRSGGICFVIVVVIMTVIGLLFERFLEPRIRGMRKLGKKKC